MTLPFTGEIMICVMCGKMQQSDARVESNWRGVVLAGKTFYACTEHFPPDGSSAKAFEEAYRRFLLRAIGIVRGEN